jgi:hypothetical protein
MSGVDASKNSCLCCNCQVEKTEKGVTIVLQSNDPKQAESLQKLAESCQTLCTNCC